MFKQFILIISGLFLAQAYKANNIFNNDCYNKTIQDWDIIKNDLESCLGDCNIEDYQSKITDDGKLDISQYIIQNNCFEDCSTQGFQALSLLDLYNCTDDNVYNRSSFNISTCIKFQCQTQYFNYMDYLAYNVLLFRCSSVCDNINVAGTSQATINTNIDKCKACLYENIDNPYFTNSLGFNRLSNCFKGCSGWKFDGILFGKQRIQELTTQLKQELTINQANMYNQSIIWNVETASTEYVGYSNFLSFAIEIYIIILLFMIIKL